MLKTTLRRAYRMLEDITPLHTDCGELCKGACCKGGDEDGMWLFPGEKELLESMNADFTYPNGEANIVVCKGSCDRKLRPLSCRIFPLFPVVRAWSRTGNPKADAVFDIRALRVCPLAKDDSESIDTAFRHRVRAAAKMLCRDREMREFLEERSEELAEMAKLI